VVPVPVLSPKLSSLWVGLVTGVPRSVVRPPIEGLENPAVVQDHPVESLVDVDRTPFDEAIDRALRVAVMPGGQPSPAAEPRRPPPPTRSCRWRRWQRSACGRLARELHRTGRPGAEPTV